MTFRKNKTDRIITKPASRSQLAQRLWFRRKGTILMSCRSLIGMIQTSYLPGDTRRMMEAVVVTILADLHSAEDKQFAMLKNSIAADKKERANETIQCPTYPTTTPHDIRRP